MTLTPPTFYLLVAAHNPVPDSIIADILRTANAYFAPDQLFPQHHLEQIIRAAIRASDEDYGIAEAVTWAGGYTFPQSMLDRSLAGFIAAGFDLTSMVRSQLERLAPHRLNHDRITQLHPNNPERSLLYDLANGMRVPLPPDFSPNGSDPSSPLRATYVRVHAAVNKMLGSIVDQDLAFLLPKTLALDHIKNLHFCSAHWAPKKGKASGRPIGDLTYVSGTPLNSPGTTAASAEFYGDIHHPTIEDIVNMVLNFWRQAKAKDPTVQWKDLRLWKLDLRGAYQLISFRPEDAALFAMELTDDLVYLQFAGIFGWSSTPAAFHVVTRAISWELRHLLVSFILMYVDDIIGVCFLQDIESELVKAQKVCTDLLGPSAVATEKTEYGTRVEVIGYVVDLVGMRVSISEKNFLNTIYGFLLVDLDAPMTLPLAQRLASWGSRYGKICRAMRPFSGALHRISAGRTSRHATFLLSDEAKLAIRCWRAMLYLLRFDEEKFSRSLDSFDVTTPPCYIIEFDASLTGAGVLLFQRVGGAEVCLGCSAVDLSSLQFGTDSSFQNVSEFIGVILGIIGLVKLGVRDVDILVRGDSISALTWVETERYRGSLVTNSSWVFTTLSIAYNISVKETIHIPGTENSRCDQLSRLGGSGETVLSTTGNFGLGSPRILDLGDCKFVRQILRGCDPRTIFSNESEFTDYWSDIRDAIEAIQHSP